MPNVVLHYKNTQKLINQETYYYSICFCKKDDHAEPDIGNNVEKQCTFKRLYTTISHYAILLNLSTKITLPNTTLPQLFYL